MKKIVTETLLETNILLLLQPLLKFSINIFANRISDAGTCTYRLKEIRGHDWVSSPILQILKWVRVSGSDLKWVWYACIPFYIIVNPFNRF